MTMAKTSIISPVLTSVGPESPGTFSEADGGRGPEFDAGGCLTSSLTILSVTRSFDGARCVITSTCVKFAGEGGRQSFL